MLSRIWNFRDRKDFADKFNKNAGGAFINFPRFASAHCTVQAVNIKIARFQGDFRERNAFLFPTKLSLGKFCPFQF